jgi:PAS domain S-box-containing protein
VIATDATGRVRFLNPVAERLTGWPSSEADGKPLNEVFSICNEYTRDTVENPVDRVLREGVVVGLANHTILINRDGSEVAIDDCAAPIHDDRGVTDGAVLVFRDVTESRRQEEQLRHSQKMEAVGQLAGGVAHDFNNMLTAILGYTELLLRAAGADHPWFGFLTEIQLASHRSAELTRQLLAFSRKERSQPKLIDLNQIVTGLDKMLKRVIGEHVELQTRLDAPVGSILADPGQLEQALVNLVVNARDAMPAGGTIVIETARVVIDHQPSPVASSVRPGEYRVLRVIDTGSGMDAKTKSRIFEPFFTTKGIGKGTGLGLAVVYGIVQMCNGHIQVESVVGKGTTFTLLFPPASDQSPPAEPVRAAADMPQGTGTVLLVEDESSVRGLAKHILISCGYTVLEAENGTVGMEVADRYASRIDLVVTDLVMPAVGGREMVSSLIKTRPGIKVLYMSGYEDPQMLSDGFPDCEATVVAKPFTPEAFAKAVHALLQG